GAVEDLAAVAGSALTVFGHSPVTCCSRGCGPRIAQRSRPQAGVAMWIGTCSVSVTCRTFQAGSRRLDGLVRAALQHLVDEAVFLRGLGALEVVALGVAGDRVERLPGVLGQDLVQPLAHGQDLARVDVDVRGLALEA